MNRLLAYTDKQSYLPGEEIIIYSHCNADVENICDNFIRYNNSMELRNIKIPDKTQYIRINYELDNNNINTDIKIINSNSKNKIYPKKNMNNLIDCDISSNNKFIIFKLHQVASLIDILITFSNFCKIINFSIFYYQSTIPYLKYKLYNDQKYLITFSSSNNIINQLYINYSFANGCNWTKNGKLKIPNEAKSGYYFIKIEYLLEIFYIPIIIKPQGLDLSKALESNCATEQPKILVLANTNTWNAYNDWAGTDGLFSMHKWLPSKQFINDDNIKTYTNIDKKKPVSKIVNFSRPNLNASIAIQEYMAKNIKTNIYSEISIYTEMYLVNYLRELHLEFDVITDFEFDKENTNFMLYKIFIMHVQPEYWTVNELQNLNYLNKNKVHIINLAGKSIFWKINYLSNKMLTTNSQFKNFKITNNKSGEEILGVYYKYIYSKQKYHISRQNSYICVDKTHRIFNNIDISSYNFGFKNLISNNKTKNSGSIGGIVDSVQISHYEKYIIARSKDNLCHMVWIDDDTAVGNVFSASTTNYVGSLLIDKDINKITKNIILYLLDK
jgi:hypothetical protein